MCAEPRSTRNDDLLPVSQGRVMEVEADVRRILKMLDTLGSPWWKRLWWRIDGYEPWWIVERRRRPRLWHRYHGPERRLTSGD